NAPKPCSFHFHRDAAGQLTEEVAYDHAGRLLWKFKYSSRDTAFFTDNTGTLVGPRSAAGASHIRFLWSPQGWEQEVRFFNGANQPTANDEWVFGRRLKYNDQGLPVSVVNLDRAGQPMRSRAGIGGARSAFDRRGNFTET